jgi:glyoxylase-like metal-dependent hydrolase (beta-lactamase superfamily II)
MRQEKEPASEIVTEVAPGVLRLQLAIALPGLAHINCYAIEDSDGFALVDPGLPGKPSWLSLLDRLKSANIPIKRVHTILVTHSHPDHFGNAGKVREESGADIITHSAFQLMYKPFHVCHLPDCDDIDHAHADAEQEQLPEVHELQTFGMKTPWGAPRWDPMAENPELRKHGTAFLAENGWPYPAPNRRVRHNEMIRLGNRDWFSVHTPGHTLDHLCLYDPQEGTLLSGDHILPTITPHISGIATGRDPLGSFFASLDRCAALPDVKRALPAHGHPFDDVVQRVDDIKEHHAERLRVLARVSQAQGESNVTEFSHYLFRQQVWGSMAESETYAHLEHLAVTGHATKRTDADGFALYTVDDFESGND